MVKVKLESDFKDYYDHWFAGSWDKSDIVFERFTYSKTSKLEDFILLKSLGFCIPKIGTVSQLDAMLLDKFSKVVVYLNDHAHAGEGKRLLSLESALVLYPNHFASEYIINKDYEYSESYRYLRVGSKTFWLKYVSYDDWRSNCGDVDISIIDFDVNLTVPQLNPLFAIDFIKTNNKLIALDYNSSPGLKWTGVEDIMTGKEVFNEIVNLLEL